VPAAEVPASAPVAAAAPRPPGCLFHPLADFLMAGGASILVAVPVFWLIRDKAAAQPTALWLSFVLSVFINYPHFAHSYQLLYDGIGERILGPNTTRKVSLRYVWAGFVAPGLIGAFLLGAYRAGNVHVLGYAANAVFFSVGWHYVKQGYGVITVLSAIRRIHYSGVEKKLLLLNGYTVWIHSWMTLNVELREQTYYGVKYFLLDLPPVALTIGFVFTVLTTVVLLVALGRRLMRKQPVSWNGIVGYVSSLYLWVIAFYADPIFMLFVPAFHSLQYLLFVWRYQVNKAHAEATVTERAQISLGRRTVVMRVARFVLVGMVLGFIGFMALPALLEASLTPDPVWGGTVFVFILAAFINLHHYFIDNVIWRRDNEDVRRFLFAPR
jgi:hypothetical protein